MGRWRDSAAVARRRRQRLPGAMPQARFQEWHAADERGQILGVATQASGLGSVPSLLITVQYARLFALHVAAIIVVFFDAILRPLHRATPHTSFLSIHPSIHPSVHIDGQTDKQIDKSNDL